MNTLILLFTLTLINFNVHCQQQCDGNNHINTMNTQSDGVVRMYRGQRYDDFRLDRRNQPIHLNQDSNNYFYNISKVTFNLTEKCREQILERELKHVYLDKNEVNVHVNGRFKDVDGCPTVADGFFAYASYRLKYHQADQYYLTATLLDNVQLMRIIEDFKAETITE